MSYAGYGQQGPTTGTSDYNAITFLVNQILARTRMMTVVKVIAVTNSGGVSPVGFCDVPPLVKMVDGIGNTSSHGTIFNVPYTRLQGGTNAIIIDPQVGDIGWLAVCDRDISAVKATKRESPPGSGALFSLADGVYLGGILNGTPTQYVRFSADGIDLLDKNGNAIKMESAGVNINGVIFDRSGNISAPGEITRGAGGADSVTLGGHEHPTAGSGPPSPPTPGT